MTRLCELADKWRADKVSTIRHDYTPYYHELLGNREVKKLLEIGIGYPELMAADNPGYKAGASLFMWEEYFPEAEIYALDIKTDILINEGRIHSYYCDQSNAASLREAAAKLGGGFDVILDDGSHVPEHQILSAEILIPLLLKETGVYIIEDVQVPVLELPSYKCEMKEFLVPRIWDDRLAIIHGAVKK